MKYYRKRFPQSSYGLADAATRFMANMDYKTAHSALMDSEVLFKVYKSLLQISLKIVRVTTDKQTETGALEDREKPEPKGTKESEVIAMAIEADVTNEANKNSS